MSQNNERAVDVVAVNTFAKAMMARLDFARQNGRGGWRDNSVVSVEDLITMMTQQVIRGQMVDAANFCMMLHQRGVRPEVIQASFASMKAQASSQGTAPADDEISVS